MALRNPIPILDQDDMASNSAAAVPTQQSVKAYVDAGNYQGLTWNESTDAYTRRGTLAPYTVGTAPGNAALPIQSAMRRCVVTDAGAVAYYLSSTDSTLKADGSAADLTGAAGQVMVEIPKFYFKYSYLSNVHTWDVSSHQLPGYVVHPAFVKNGVEVAACYIGAYEAALYDASAAVYTGSFNPITSHSVTVDVDDGTGKGTITAGAGTPYALLQAGDSFVVTGTADNNGTYVISTVTSTIITTTGVIAGADGVEATTVISPATVDTANDKLASVSGKKAFTNIIRANYRSIAAKRGTGWRQFDFYLCSAIQLLYLVEYASFYSQSMIGAGITNVSDWAAYNNYYPIANTGNSNVIGNATGNTGGAAACATEVSKYLSYRGIENWFGHLWKFIDGFNVNNNIPYVSNTDTQFADDTATNYIDLGVTMHNTDGYPATLEQVSAGFLPASVGASSTTKLTDYYWQNTGWRVALFGACAHDGGYAGGFYWGLFYAAGYAYSCIGTRVCF